jgi:hypothetical protein
VAGDNRGSAPSAGDIEAVVSGNPNSGEQGEQMSGWSKVTKPIPVPNE